MEIKIKIEAPELSHAIETLAIAIGCTVDKIGVGEVIKEAVDQGPKVTEKVEKVTKETDKVTKETDKVTEKAEKVTETKNSFTREDVRAAFVEKNSPSTRTQLKAILDKYDTPNISELKEEHFDDVMKELEAM